VPLPSDLTAITVTGTYTSASGVPLAGTVNFMLTVPVTDSTGRVILAPGTTQAPLNPSGSFSVTLACTDNADLSPNGFTYLVTEVIPGLGRAYSISLPHTLGTSVDLSQLVPVVTVSSVTPYLLAANNLSDVPGPGAALSALGGLPKSGGTMTGSLVTQVPNIVFDGDSLTIGTGALPFNNFPLSNDYPSQVAACLDARGSYYNVGVAGETVATMITNAPAVVDAKLVSGAENIVVLAGGTNDIYYTDSAATAYSNIVTYCQARQAAGWKVVICTITPRDDSGAPADFETQRQALNTSIRSNWHTFANALADVGNDANIGQAGNYSNTQYYNGDLVHHNPNGYWVRAGYVLAALGTLGVATGGRRPDRSALLSDLWVPAAVMYATSGSPALGTISSYPAWSLHHGSVDVVAWTGLLPEDWLSFTVCAVWSNTAGAPGNAALVLRYSSFTAQNFGSSPSNLATSLTASGTATVASPASYRTVSTALATLTANNGNAPRVAWNLSAERNGSSGADTLTGDAVQLLGLYIYRVT